MHGPSPVAPLIASPAAVSLLVAQTAGGVSRWLMLGGALIVLGVGLAVVVAARIGRRRDLERRMAVRDEIASILAADARRAHPSTTEAASGDPEVVIDLGEEEASSARRSPMSAYMPEVQPRDTFIDLPADDPAVERVADPVIDLTEEAVDLTEQRKKARPDPRS